MKDADRIRTSCRERYVLPAHQRGDKSFSIIVGDVLRKLKMTGRAPAICSALKTKKFLQTNGLKLVHTCGPKSGQSTTVTYTYEFDDGRSPSPGEDDSWSSMRGALKDVFAALGGGEAYLRAERSNFYPPKESR